MLSMKTYLLATKACLTYTFVTQQPFGIPYWNLDTFLNKYRRAFIVYMFWRPPEVWSLMCDNALISAEMCSERDSPLKRLYRRTHAKLTRLAGSGQLVWAPGCELSLALVHTRRPARGSETSETTLRVALPRKTWPPNHTGVNWPVDDSASGWAQVGATGELHEFRLAGSRQDKRLDRAIPLTKHLWFQGPARWE